ncbi:hypothetical protein BpHYR1_015803 [Brachionus plicatilis]|uniref:Uncharacterized protein n=1 Tax=Brachionus plicatilis TaxID=10195 RepID=A0A3M7SYA7_BRAPC|nr:hypothetical protein BpHYR1_015803 [Brachionus plicatilis]
MSLKSSNYVIIILVRLSNPFVCSLIKPFISQITKKIILLNFYDELLKHLFNNSLIFLYLLILERTSTNNCSLLQYIFLQQISIITIKS